MLKISNLHAGYGKIEVLHGIDLEVPKGKVVTLIGSNGAGKTTTMRAVSGMIAASAGSIVLGTKEIAGLESYDIAKLGLAHSPEGRRVFATMSVTDNLVPFRALPGRAPKVTSKPIWSGRWSISPASKSAGCNWPAPCQAVSNRCWPWHVR
jgi:ABC-type branched-subunit amino acid transport system ATPase component